MGETVFYSWQTDLPNRTNRGFIEAALQTAVTSVRSDLSIEQDPRLDRDTAGVPGSPDIAITILQKIERSSAFVGDVSIINSHVREAGAAGVPERQERLTPNPNVLVELGYAAKALTWSRVVMVLNTAFGSAEDLPFDLRQRRCVRYKMLEEAPSRSEERRKLATMLERELRAIVALQVQAPQDPLTPIDVRFGHKKAAPFRSEVHVYDLTLQVQNMGSEAIQYFELEFAFPDIDWLIEHCGRPFATVHPDPVSKHISVTPSGRVTIHRDDGVLRIAYRSLTPLLRDRPRDLSTDVNLRYWITSTGYRLSKDLHVEYTVCADDMKPKIDRIPFRSLQNF